MGWDDFELNFYPMSSFVGICSVLHLEWNEKSTIFKT